MKAVGKQGGVVKNTVIIPVKLDWQVNYMDFIDAFYKIYDYVIERNLQGRGVITQSTTPAKVLIVEK